MPAPIRVWGVCFQGCTVDPFRQKRALHLARAMMCLLLAPFIKGPVKKEMPPGEKWLMS